ncbi:MAG: FMN-binding protein [Halioglobus sp.]|nr:FMN-binding protein [Halioglobus sp.]
MFVVLPGVREFRALRLDNSANWPRRRTQRPGLYAGYDADGGLVGVAIEARGMGYQDDIRLLYGDRPDTQRIVGLEVLQSRETPGLGSRIESHASFLESFRSLDVSLAADGATLRHPIVLVDEGDKSRPWEVDGITGATVSARAPSCASCARAPRALAAGDPGAARARRPREAAGDSARGTATPLADELLKGLWRDNPRRSCGCWPCARRWR